VRSGGTLVGYLSRAGGFGFVAGSENGETETPAAFLLLSAFGFFASRLVFC
jgi:hypothetical protein